MEFFLCFIIAMIITGGRSATDIIAGLRGTDPPHLTKARLRAQQNIAAASGAAAQAPVTASVGDVVAAYWGSALADVIARRARAQAAKRSAAEGGTAGPNRASPPDQGRGEPTWEPVGKPRPERQPAGQGGEEMPDIDPWLQQPTHGRDRGDRAQSDAQPDAVVHDTPGVGWRWRYICHNCKGTGPWRDTRDAVRADAENHKCIDGSTPPFRPNNVVKEVIGRCGDTGCACHAQPPTDQQAPINLADAFADLVEAQEQERLTEPSPCCPVDNPCPRHRTDQPDPGVTATPTGNTTNPEGDPMTTTNTAPTAEATGIKSAITHVEAVADAHRQHGGNEGLVASLAGWDVGPDDIAVVQAAQEASRNAAAMWEAAATALTDHNEGVRQAYMVSPGAANKTGQINE